MGVFDTYWNLDHTVGVQIKAGNNTLSDYTEGEFADAHLPDGVYFGFEGAVVIRGGVVEKVTESAATVAEAMTSLPVLTKWGGHFNPATEDIGDHNPLVAALREYNKTIRPL